MKNNKGITLIALVVTIIVLLILAGVSIAMLTGQNGILNKASDAGEETAVANAKEKVTLAINEAITNYYDDNYTGTNESETPLSLYGAQKKALEDISPKEESGATITVGTESVSEPKTIKVTIKYKTKLKVSGTLTEAEGNKAVFTWDTTASE